MVTPVQTEKNEPRIRLALDIDEMYRRRIRIEALEHGMSMKDYVQAILDRRHELVGIRERVGT